MKTLYISMRDNDWAIILLIVSLFLVNTLRFVFPNLFFLMLYNKKDKLFSDFFIEKKQSIFNWFFGIIEIMFYTHIALFIFSFLNVNYFVFNLFETRFNYWGILLLLFSYYLIKQFLIHFAFSVFSQNHMGKLYIAFKAPFHFFLFVFLIVFNSLIYFSSFPLPVLIIVTMCAFIISYAYLLLLFVTKNYNLIKNNLFIFFLYFCTLEILPLLLIGKAIIF